MVKELVRNGGFESGDSKFWVSTLVAGIAVADAHKKYGSYGAKVLATEAQVDWNIAHKDLLPVSLGEVYIINFWHKVKVRLLAAYYLNFYDSDGSYITYQPLGTGSTNENWAFKEYFVMIPRNVAFIQLFMTSLFGAAADYLILDSVSIQRIAVEKLAVKTENLITVLNLAVKQTAQGESFFAGVWREAEFTLSCTSLTGTNPTLNVAVQAFDPCTAAWYNVLVFQQLVAAGEERKTVLSGLGWLNRVNYTTGGDAVTDCNFKVGAVYKR